ncbi:hypothetical protein R3X27_02765 [Tropicimonas sp. TH_r6]|uniref:hypothetical protein n=1 Tax=Tropicimonas sp. TH_r6 TaxID=3082085 RepID=UPI002953027D|nr:hypothetical protein [Tropicimonas sp. TH_r6]MDV7141596.1 hypothetical protein [Tropicimonas sp. TH_r6]
MPPRTYLILLVAVILIAGVTIGVASMAWTSVAPWIGIAFMVLVALRLYRARRWIDSEKEEQ